MRIKEKDFMRLVAVLDDHVEGMHTVEIVLRLTRIGRLITCEHRPHFVLALIVLKIGKMVYL